MRAGRVARVIAGNGLVLLALMAALNFLSSLILDGQYWLERVFVRGDARVDLPNFEDKQLAATIFAETRDLRTGYAPYVAWTRRELHGSTVNVDANGDRTHLPTTQQPVGHVRLFGGSTMWGTGVADDQTIPAIFNALNPSWHVHNHGQSSYVSRQELAALANLVSRGEPMDLVVFYDGYNDVRNLCRSDVTIPGHARQRKLARLVSPRSFALDDVTASLVEVVRFAVESLNQTEYEPSRCLEDEGYGDQITDQLVANWRMARAVAHVAGASFVGVLQPVAAIGSPNLSHLADDAFSLDDYSTAKKSELARGIDHARVYPGIQRRIRDEREHRGWMVDFSDAFDSDEIFYIGPAHVSSNGNRRIAERLDALVGDRLRALERARLEARAVASR